MAYGQTGTGKTHTMEGFKYNNSDPQRGIVSRAAEEIFKYIENCSDKNVKKK
jgi:kinesin family protein 3/17